MFQTIFPKITIGVATTALLLSGCGGSKTVNETISAEDIDKVVTQNARMAYAVHSDSVSTAESLKTAINTFVAKPAPTDADLTNLKNSWLSREILFFILFFTLALIGEYFLKSNLYIKWLAIFLGL